MTLSRVRWPLSSSGGSWRELVREILTATLLGFAPLAVAAPALPPVPARATPASFDLPASNLRQQVEADWLRQVTSRETPGGAVTTQSDAQGACDGVRNGNYGFHAGLEPNSWWQVDLGRPVALARVVVFNRLDYAPGLHNADNLRVFTSDDGRAWTLRREIKQQHFGGVSGAPPWTMDLKEGEVTARFVRLQVPSAQPIFFHLDEVEVFGHGTGPMNLARWRPADQSSLSPWSIAKHRPVNESERVYPTAEWIARGRRLVAERERAGVDCLLARVTLEHLASQLGTSAANVTEPQRRELYLQTRRVVRELVLSDPLLNFDRLLFVKRITQETYPDVCLNHLPWVSRPGGDLCILSARSGKGLFQVLAAPEQSGATGVGMTLSHLLNGALGPGHVHGMDLSWDGRRVVFGYARVRSGQPPAGWLDRTQSYRLRREEEPIHLFELEIASGALRQLSHGEWSDLDPTYAPNGDIVFVSERCGTSLQCNEYDKDETSCNLYVMRPDGSAIRRLSVNKDGDYLPHTLDDGTIGYTRWEYHERSWAFIQSLWIVRPDGTGADAIFKQHFVDPWALEDARSIPRSKKLVAVAAGHHTLAVGPVVVINPAIGINEPAGISIVTPGVKPPEGGMAGVPVAEGGVIDEGGFYSTPWALSEKTFLVSYTYGPERDTNGYALYLIDVYGNKELLLRDPAISCFQPIPLRPRAVPPVYAPVVAASPTNEAVCVVNDIGHGVEGIAPGQIKYLRIAEPIGWPYDNALGGQRYGEDHGYGGPGAERKNLLNWTPVRILGDVPVERDGSAHFAVPPDTAVYFQLLDENRMELRRMRSFLSFQSGETRACVGCHESRAVAPIPSRASLAAQREPTRPIAPPWGHAPVSFLRDVQPVLDRHCVGCHSGLKPAGGLDFFGGLTSFDAKIPGYGHNRAFETIMENGLVSISAVRAQDASITPPLAYGARNSRLVTALDQGSHAGKVKLSEDDRLRLVMWIDANAPYHDLFVNKRVARPAYDLASDATLQKSIAEVHQRRCASCHKPDAISRLDWIDVAQPARTLFLSAPLARDAGGSGRCGQMVYPAATDPDYQAVRRLVLEAVQRALAQPRRDLQALADLGVAPPR